MLFGAEWAGAEHSAARRPPQVSLRRWWGKKKNSEEDVVWVWWGWRWQQLELGSLTLPPSLASVMDTLSPEYPVVWYGDASAIPLLYEKQSTPTPHPAPNPPITPLPPSLSPQRGIKTTLPPDTGEGFSWSCTETPVLFLDIHHASLVWEWKGASESSWCVLPSHLCTGHSLHLNISKPSLVNCPLKNSQEAISSFLLPPHYFILQQTIQRPPHSHSHPSHQCRLKDLITNNVWH